MKKLIPFSLIFCLWAGEVLGQTINFQNFNTGINGGWTAINGGTTPYTWLQAANYNGNTLNGSAFAFVNSDANPTMPRILDENLQSPLFNGNSYSNVYLEFDHYYRDYSTDTGFVDVFNGTAWIRVAFYSTNQGAWNAPSHVFLDLTAYRNANMRVRFRFDDNGVWAWWWAVDNVLIWAPYPLDAQLLARTAPFSGCAMSATEPVSVRIYNAGVDTITTINASYRINNGPIITELINTTLLPVDTLDYNFVTPANLSASGSYTFKFWTSVAGDVYLTNDTLSNIVVTNFPIVNSFPYIEDFESGAANWFVNGTNSTWTLGTPAKDVIIGAASGTQAWVTGGLGTTDYANNEKSQVNSPCYDFSSLDEPWVLVNVWWNAEYSWDGVALQSSTNGGQTWATVGVAADPFNWYTDNSLGGLPGGQQQGWTGRNSSGNGSAMWKLAKHNLTSLANRPEVLFRMAFGSDGSVTDDGFAFDKFIIANAPKPNLGPDTTFCDSLVLDPGPGYSLVSWNNGTNAQTITLTDDAVSIVTVTDTFGLTGKDTVSATLFLAEGPELGADAVLCDGDVLILDAGNQGVFYNWTTGDTTQFASITQSGTYSVFVNFPYGCTGTDTMLADFHNLFAGFDEPDTLCRNEPMQFIDTSTGATSWYWNFGNGFNSTLQNPNFVFLSGGTYIVSLIVSDGVCTDTITKTLFVDNCINTGIASIIDEAFVLFPNPAHDNVTIRSGNLNGEAQVILTNMQGVALRSQRVSLSAGESVSFSLHDLSSGVYFITVASDAGNWVQRFIVE
jgi:Secretion system C-terminal sorting domain/PKD domain